MNVQMNKGPALAVLIILTGIVLSFWVNPLFVWAAIMATTFVIPMMGNLRVLALISLAWAWVAPVTLRAFPMGLLRRVDDILVLAVLAVVLGHIVFRRISALPYGKLYLSFCGLCAFSFLLNGTSPVSFGLFMLAYGSPILFLYLFGMLKYPDLWRDLIRFLLVVFCVGVLLNVGWFLGINPIYNRHLGTVDFAKGTLGGCDIWSYFTIFIFFLCLSLARHAVSTKTRWFCWGMMGVTIMQFYLAYTKHAYFYLVAALLVFVVITRQSMRSILGFAMLGLVGILLFSAVSRLDSSFSDAKGAGGVVTVEEFQQRWSRFLRNPKVKTYDRVIWSGVDEGFMGWLVGHGPGAGIGTVARTRPSPYSYRILGDIYLTHSGRESMVGSSVTQSPFAGPTSLWSEVGLIGTGILYGLVLHSILLIWRNLRTGLYDANRMQLVLAEAYVVYAVLFILINLLRGVWSADPLVFLLWAMFATVLRPMSTDGITPVSVGDSTKEMR